MSAAAVTWGDRSGCRCNTFSSLSHQQDRNIVESVHEKILGIIILILYSYHNTYNTCTSIASSLLRAHTGVYTVFPLLWLRGLCTLYCTLHCNHFNSFIESHRMYITSHIQDVEMLHMLQKETRKQLLHRFVVLYLFYIYVKKGTSTS